MKEGRSLIFKNKISAIGSKNNKIKFLSESKNPWENNSYHWKKYHR